MNKIEVKNNQTLFDIALQETGAIESVFDLLVLNNLVAITQDVEQGTELIAPNMVNKTIKNQLTGLKRPATSSPYMGSSFGEFEISEFNNEEFLV